MGLRFRVKVNGEWFQVKGLGLRVQVSESRDWGLEFGVCGLGFKVCPYT